MHSQITILMHHSMATTVVNENAHHSMRTNFRTSSSCLALSSLASLSALLFSIQFCCLLQQQPFQIHLVHPVGVRCSPIWSCLVVCGLGRAHKRTKIRRDRRTQLLRICCIRKHLFRTLFLCDSSVVFMIQLSHSCAYCQYAVRKYNSPQWQSDRTRKWPSMPATIQQK